MAIYTLADLYVPPRRSSSIPRQYHRMAAAGRQDHRFSLADAVDLKPKLQALDKALAGTCTGHSRGLDFTSIDDAVSMQSPHVAVYVDGSEEFFLMVKTVSRPDLIPKVLAEAIKAMFHGRPYVNISRTSDFRKGADPTFSDFRPILPDIDRLCGTNLAGVVARLEAQGKLRLRLQVYSYVLPEHPRGILPPWCRKSNGRRLALMRVNKQLHSEVRKHYYENVNFLIATVFQLENTSLYEDNTMSLRQLIESMDPNIFPLIKQLSVRLNDFSVQESLRTETRSPPFALKYIFDTFTGLERLTITFGTAPRSNMWAGHDQESIQRKYVDEMKTRFIKYIPPSIKVSWWHEDAARFFNSDTVEKSLWTAIQERASTYTDESIGTPS
ncbi:hypothetical protein COCC4DRAFT_196830 [Bipolaris maydis ATCC 48331]|uniref:Uncharacterized protein n=2 Tax=Cochliobolus heterostrophus TaxID=5016 RepID=M2UYX4_COCH5|nr:uncharacterized protein COCC4DRAFT_196830 [Bipolaris maydis ATCC 48331]EMD93008.1 hypothetical protein COCHEDRAFT_1172768 [Bipolaris maydis C5]KAJ5033050.1 hypothetical protein J3E74DRAFT_285166 [Bipolaris maydis]ENI04605.1 hypothetical protein COCC4DRAFT_196830 [Bipolaris maydis ATCC 48331]KAJ5056466.1 hypothetical protein J3E74DRAFT_278985 [Bipolaris maydis]KAJ6196062.1 hypothetical protein J3E72DRAFT_245236 [Bipolaris maydis]